MEQAAAFKRYALQYDGTAISGQGEDCAGGVTRLWRLLSSYPHIRKDISELCQVAEIGMLMVAGFVEDERGFSAMGFLKDKLCNTLDMHLETCMRM